ncbi:MAG: restriction endonuclease [Nitrospira sp. BO4]|jgi:restriction system protein|nr:restriction endonuclease [Nitrospira sp. BO4]
MAVPDFQSFFKPLLDLAADGQEHSIQEARTAIAKQMALPEADLNERLPSGIQTKFENRVAWAKSYFIQAKIFEAPRRSVFKITDRGRELLRAGHKRIDIRILNQYPEFLEFHKGRREEETENEVEAAKETPEETLQKSYQSIRNDLASQIVQRISQNTPKFFERLVVDLMVAMGYGGSRANAGRPIGRPGDEGIDGVINEDKLGLDLIYLQAKRWEGTVGRPDVQKFVGALHGKRAQKGVFITTAKFSDDAKRYVEAIDPKVILIDGRTLAELMIDHGLGTTTTANYEVKRIDSDYFTEE